MDPDIVKSGCDVSAESINSGQHVRNAQADLSRYFMPLVNFLYIQVQFYIRVFLVVKQR